MATAQVQQNVVVTQVYPNEASYLYAVAYYSNPANGGVTIDSQDPVARTIVFHKDETASVNY